MATIASNVRPDYRPIGTNTSALVADSTKPDGVKWKLLVGNDVLPAFAITSFSISPSAVLIGTDVDPPDFTASYNRAASGATVDNDGGYSPVSMDPPNYTTGNGGSDFFKTTPDVINITITASGYGGTSISSGTLSFLQNKYWGVSTTGIYNQAFIEALSNNRLALVNSGSFTLISGSGQYMWYAFRSNIGTPTFYNNGLSGGFQLISTGISFTVNSITENYQLWRADYPNLGTVMVVVL